MTSEFRQQNYSGKLHQRKSELCVEGGALSEVWELDIVRSKDGNRNCFFRRLFAWPDRTADNYGQGAYSEAWANDIWSALEVSRPTLLEAGGFRPLLHPHLR